MINVLKAVYAELNKLGVNYSYLENKQKKPTYPYWVGSYTCPEGMTEDGELAPTFILTGFFREFTALEIEQEKEKISEHFKGGRIVNINGSVVVIYTSNVLDIPQDFDDLHKSEIYLSIKYWKGK